MLPDYVATHAQAASALAVEDLLEQLALRFGAINSEAAAAGSFRSGARIAHSRNAAEEQSLKIAQAIWQTVRDAYDASVSKPELGHKEELRSIFNTLFAPIETVLTVKLNEQSNLGGAAFGERLHDYTSELVPLIARSKKKVELGIDLHVEARMGNQKGSDNRPNVTINATGSVVQTGDGSVANVAGGLNVYQEQVSDALLRVVEAILRSPTVPTQSTAMLAAVAEANTIVKSPSLDKGRLKAALEVLTNGLQGISAAEPAYEAVQNVLRALGLQ